MEFRNDFANFFDIFDEILTKSTSLKFRSSIFNVEIQNSKHSREFRQGGGQYISTIIVHSTHRAFCKSAIF